MNILLLTTGSISAPLSRKLSGILESMGHKVEHIISKNAEFVWRASGKDFPEILHAKSIDDECNLYLKSREVIHIDVVNRNVVCVICPADFNTIGKLANGIADDLVSSTLAAWLGSGKNLFIAEAMNSMMYANPVHLSNVAKLDMNFQVNFIEPTVKKLACGDYGIGGLADVNTIANIIDGHHWIQPVKTADRIDSAETHCCALSLQATQRMNGPKNTSVKKGFDFRNYLPCYDEPGAFGAKRKYDRHEGVDIYCKYGSRVYAVEDGVVVDSCQYTGTKETGEWWNPTWCLKVKERSGVITYGELQMPNELPTNAAVVSKPSEELKFGDVKYSYPAIGASIKAGDMIGYVGKVLPDSKKRDDIRNHNNCMLHTELRTESCHLDGWKLDGDGDKKLLDPTPYLKSKLLS